MATTMTWITPTIKGGSTSVTSSNVIKIESSSSWPKSGNPSSYPSQSTSGTTIGCSTANDGGWLKITLNSTFPVGSKLTVSKQSAKTASEWPTGTLTGDLVRNCDKRFTIQYGDSSSNFVDLVNSGFIKYLGTGDYERWQLYNASGSTANSRTIMTTKPTKYIWSIATNNHGGVQYGCFRLQLSYKDYILTFKTLTDDVESTAGGVVKKSSAGITSDTVIDGMGNYTYVATPNTGYKFKQWSWTDKDGVAHTQTDPTLVTNYNGLGKDLTVTAEFVTAYEVTLNVNDPLGGTVTGDGEYDLGDSATVVATPNTNYVFKGWYNTNDVLVSTNSSYTFTVSESVELLAEFVTSYVVTLTKNISEAGTLIGAGSYASGSIVVIQAIANTGWKFLGWYLGSTKVSATPSYGFTITSNVTYEAKFEQRQAPTRYSGRTMLCG